MRKVFSVALLAALASSPAIAQSMSGPTTTTAPAKHVARPTPPAGMPVDHGPFTPEASQAYQGGGMVLQGAPGAPPPQPQPTPPGQVPRNMVPQ